MEKINIDKRKYQETKEIELKQDVIVPDTKPDIFQIKDQNFYCYFNKVKMGNGKIDLNGNVDVSVLYLSSGEENIGLQSTISFEDVLTNDNILENMNLKYDIDIQKQEVKIVNERKISILLTLKITYEVYGVDSIELDNDFTDIEDVQVNSKRIAIHSLVGSNSNLASLKEEIKLESTDIASDILKIATEISNKEIKISHNKVLTKADLVVSITYLTKDERVCEIEEKFPVMSFIEIENVKEEDMCITDYQVRNILLNMNNSEENSIIVQMEYEIYCKAFENKELDVVSDLYSLKYDISFTTKEIEIASSNNETETIKIVQNVSKKEISNQEEYSMVVYCVKKNDSLWDISKRFRVNQENIIKSNGLEEPYNLRVGEKIYVIR
ncbi:MAG: DUF3794 domain-containing protein [Clostridia bacterium]|nr:DUF3794 domain-containing protein [Clostridia bacterium]